MPIAWSTMANSPEVTCSPEATTASYSRASCIGNASRHHSTSSLVLPDMAETMTATSWPASTSRLTCRATLRMRSTLATLVPPNFRTRRAISSQGSGLTRQRRGAYRGGSKAGQRQENAMLAASLKPDEVARFDALAQDWWNPDGPMAPLHRINPVRIGWLIETLARR